MEKKYTIYFDFGGKMRVFHIESTGDFSEPTKLDEILLRVMIKDLIRFFNIGDEGTVVSNASLHDENDKLLVGIKDYVMTI